MSNDFQSFMNIFNEVTIQPEKEMLAYEALWCLPSMTVKKMAELFTSSADKFPSKVLLNYYGGNVDMFDKQLMLVNQKISSRAKNFSVSMFQDFQYPLKLRDAKYPVELMYYIGDIDLTATPCVSVVGTRKISADGVKRTQQVVKLLVDNGYTVISGLAHGVDTVAHETCIEIDGRTIAVIGTPIDRYYPVENKELQDRISSYNLLISQVPFLYYDKIPFQSRKFLFPQRNVTMAALSIATVIVEAGKTSGTQTQARACIQQGRKLFILNNVFENKSMTWPEYYYKRGAIRARKPDDIIDHLSDARHVFQENSHTKQLDNIYRKFCNDAKFQIGSLENN